MERMQSYLPRSVINTVNRATPRTESAPVPYREPPEILTLRERKARGDLLTRQDHAAIDAADRRAAERKGAWSRSVYADTRRELLGHTAGTKRMETVAQFCRPEDAERQDLGICRGFNRKQRANIVRREAM